MKNVLLTAAGMLLLAGCTSVQRTPPMEVWDDMKHQGKYTAQASSGFFADGRATRLAPEDTVAHGYLAEETPYNTGMDGTMYVGKSPVPMTAALLDQGQTKFNIYCQPCHDKTGSGRGIVPTRVQADGGAPWTPANLNEQRLVEAADGETKAGKKIIVVSRSSEMKIVDGKNGLVLTTANIPYGATLFVMPGQSVKKGDKICEWDPYTA